MIVNTDTRNVTDFYKGWETDAIKADLDTNRLPFITAFEHVNGDFNKATGIRNTNGFLGREVWIVGERARRYDKRGTVGTHHYEHVKFAQTWARMLQSIGPEYVLVAFDNVEGATALQDFEWPEKVVMMFGEEQRGLSDEALELADSIVYIPMRGSVRSFNVGTASGIAMYDYSMKMGVL
jgi:tRNA G18 (ribose-2'-O)-methylase SpoU